MKERVERTFRHLHGKHSDAKPAARRLGAFAAALALMAAIVLSPAQGIAYALTAEDEGTDEADDGGIAVILPELDEEKPVYTDPDELPPEETGTVVITYPDPGDGDLALFDEPDTRVIDDTYGLDFTPYLRDDSPKLEYRKQGQTDWTTLTQGTDPGLGYNDELRVTMEFDLPMDALAGTDDSVLTKIYYPLPSGWEKVTDDKAGNVVTDLIGTVNGSYKIANGKVQITFNDWYAEDHVHHQIEGSVTFSGKLSEVIGENGGSLNLNFRETDSWNITVKPKPVDLTIAKSTDYTVTDLSKNVVGYAVTIGSTTGTNDTNVTLHDTLTTSPKNASVVNGAIYDENALKAGLSVYKKGDRITGTLLEESDWTLQNVTVDGRKSSFDLVLPPLEAGEYYTVYYQAQVVDEDKLRGDFNFQNSATATAGTEENPAVAGPAKAQLFSVGGIIKKSADYDKTNHIITWTITVNECRANIAGYYLRDFLNGANAQTEQHLNAQMYVWDDAENNWDSAQAVELPYSFGSEENHNYYKFVYTTPDTPQGNGTNNIWNRAYLTTLPTDTSVALNTFPYSTVIINADMSNIYQKTGDGIANRDVGEAIPLQWTLRLKPARDLTGWTIKDTFQDDQYMAYDQRKALEGELAKAFGDIGYTIGYEWIKDGNENDELKRKAKNFTIVGTDTWPANMEVAVPYTTAVDTDKDTEQSYTFTNKVVFDNYVMTATNYYHYGNVVQKVDVTDGEETLGDVTEHDLDKLPKDADGNPTMKWDVIVTMTNKLKEAPSFTITDTLPENVELTGLKLKGKYVSSDVEFTKEADGSWTATVNGTQVTAAVANNVVTLVVPAAVYQDKTSLHNEELRLEVDVTPTGTEDWVHNNTYKFLNRVKVSSKGLQGPHENQQEQDIFYNANYDAVSKSGTEVTNANNQVRYTVKVNPQGKQYLDGKSRLKLTDTLTYTYTDTAVLLADKEVHVYKMVNGEKGEELSPSEYSYTYQEGERKASGTTVQNVLTFELPDATPLIVEYIYYGKGNSKETTFTLDNSAVLEGTSSHGTSVENGMNFRVIVSQAQVNAKGINLYKMDSDNFNTMLEGARFTLSVWNGSDWQIVDDTVYSGSDGRLRFSSVQWQNDVAYRLEETQAPTNYYRASDPLYFYVNGKGRLSAPADVNVVPYEVGQTVRVTNQKVKPSTIPTAALNLYKYTTTADGTEKALDGAKFKLYRAIGGTKYYTVLDSSNKATGWTANAEDAAVLTTPDSGELHLEGLPAGEYYLEETAAPTGYDKLTEPVVIMITRQEDGSFTTTVSGNAELKGGVVCIENTETPDPDPEPEPEPKPDPEPTPTPDPEPTPVIPVLPVTPLDPSDVPEEPETPADSDSREEEPASSETTPEQPAESEQPASSDSGEQPASPEEDASSLRPGAPTPDNQDGWVLGEHGKDDPAASSDASKPGAPTPDNQKGWVLNAKDGTGLIQTGQLNWPIPVLIALGAALIAAGVWLNHRAKRHKD